MRQACLLGTQKNVFSFSTERREKRVIGSKTSGSTIKDKESPKKKKTSSLKKEALCKKRKDPDSAALSRNEAKKQNLRQIRISGIPHGDRSLTMSGKWDHVREGNAPHPGRGVVKEKRRKGLQRGNYR